MGRPFAESPAGIEIGGVTGEVGRDGEGAGIVGADGDLADDVRHRALGRERFHGAGGAEDDVGMLEEVCHRFVHLDAELLEPGAVLGAVGGGGAHREGDLEGEVLLAVGPVVLEVGDEGGEARRWPR